jgi:hypothetical protein
MSNHKAPMTTHQPDGAVPGDRSPCETGRLTFSAVHHEARPGTRVHRHPPQKARDIRAGMRVTCQVNSAAAAEKLAALAHQSLRRPAVADVVTNGVPVEVNVTAGWPAQVRCS